jgi:hypothetical protein
MSRDLFVLAAASPLPPYEELSQGWQGIPLGSIEEVRQKLATVEPNIEWTDAGWGSLDREGISIEFDFGGREPCDSMMIYVRGDFESPHLRSLLASLKDKYLWYSLDIEEGKWFEGSARFIAGTDTV